jgi:tRNA pseudouridine32 synthase/23S rRNA pseudouridine746 synthase
MNEESATEHYNFKRLKRSLREIEIDLELQISKFEGNLDQLKEKRRKLSSELQQKLFEQYTFLNGNGDTRDLLSIFNAVGKELPPSGAGECAAPKLLQFAYSNKLTPLTMAEFWWGASPLAEVKKHGNFYPSCRGKCEPILQHMLKGIPCDPDPVEEKLNQKKHIRIIYEDSDIAVIEKPHDLLSVPGKGVFDSVLQQLKSLYPLSTGPMTVHRLDMSTSGIMVLAKTLEAYHHLQKQFLKRTVKKRYIALLDGNITGNEGCIELPMRVDLEDRPRQVICHEYGKQAVTRWKKISESNGKTRVHFFPETGRTHQLRVHSAHKEGLNCAILGDDLYGKKGERLHLHAEEIEFMHPTTKKRCSFKCKAPF